jgi:hypothetical protein
MAVRVGPGRDPAAVERLLRGLPERFGPGNPCLLMVHPL